MKQKNKFRSLKILFNSTVLVCALGYFVDIYDLILFGIVRVASLKSLGVPPDQLINYGVLLLNMQMIGMLIGGIFWGIIGDKKGRLSVLFGSILLYSLANFSNAFVTNTTMYAILRFIAGVGLAGELGAAITLVSEVMTKELRGYGTALVATIGVTGAIFAAVIGEIFTWQTSYIVGGILGFILLIMRIKMFESGMFSSIKDAAISKGKFLSLFSSRERIKRYVNCILIGLPIWFVVGVLITFSPEFAKVLGYREPILAGRSIMYTYTGLIFGDFISGFFSQYLKSRKKVVAWFLLLSLLFIIIYLFVPGKSSFYFYTLCILLGFAIGYWAVFVTIASEQFGTNMRSTVTTTVPNIVRGAVVPITLAFEFFRYPLGMIYSALTVGLITFGIAFFALYHLSETFEKNLDFLENFK